MKIPNNFANSLKKSKSKILFITLGTLSVAWFLVRVIPKPSRAVYPCQRAAFPIASTFLVWLSGTLISYLSFKRARRTFANRKPAAIALFSLASLVFLVTYVVFPSENLKAKAMYVLQEQPLLKTAYNIEADQFIEPQAYVSIVRSDKENAEEIDYTELESMIREAVEMAGGLGDIITDGDVVVLKPNMVSSYRPDGDLPLTANGMITDWRVVSIVAKMARELNPTGTILVMEGSAENTMDGYNRMNYNKTSMPDVDEFKAIEDCSGEWLEYDAPELSSAVIPDGKALYPNSEKPNKSDAIFYNKIYYEADVLISLPVLKNHESAGVTGAVKNLSIGATPTNIYGNSDDSNGRWNIIPHDASTLHKWLHDYYYLRPADFAIMDGLQGWNNGPVFNHGAQNLEGHQENMKVILASRDAIAMDAIEGLLMGDDPRNVSYMVYLNNSGLGCADPLAIRVLGTEVSDIKKSFPHDLNKTVCTYTDFTAPDVSMASMALADNILSLSFTTPTRISSVEVEIDDAYYPEIVISDFDDISLDMAAVSCNDNSSFNVYVNDKYLNTTVFSYDGTAMFPVNVELLSAEKQYMVYPNPVRDKLNIRIDNDYQGDIDYSIHSLNGQLIISGMLKKSYGSIDKQIDVSALKTGSYVLTFDTGITQFTKRIIKQ